LEVEEVVVFVGGEDFLLDCEIVQVKQAHRGSQVIMGGSVAKKPLQTVNFMDLKTINQL
jgi:hypothetical protein